MNSTEKDTLKQKLHSKLGLMKMRRSSKNTKTNILETTLKNSGLDVKEFENNMKDLNKNIDLTKYY